MGRWFSDRCAERGIPAVSLRRLLPEAEFLGCPDLIVSGASDDSRRLEPGQVFVAVAGRSRDGHDFIPRALERGAVGVIAERSSPEIPTLQCIVPDSRSAHARLAHALAGSPGAALRIVAITGAHGRRATARFLGAILDETGQINGHVGPGSWSDGREIFHAVSQTPGPDGLATMLAAAADRGARAMVLNLSTRAIDERATDGIPLDAVVVTGLGGEQPPDDVRRRRSLAGRLARALKPGGRLILPADDSEAAPLAGTALRADVHGFGLGEGDAPNFEVHIDQLGPSGSSVRVRREGHEVKFTLRPPGTRNIRCAIAALLAAEALGIEIATIVAGLESVDRIPGSLESVDRGQPFAVRIDRARTGPALTRSLQALRETSPTARVHCVFGAKGGTGLADRLALARAAEGGADRLYLTSDDPMSDDPAAILDDLAAGLKWPGRAVQIADRREAIATALEAAEPGDVVLLAGKGRDRVQLLATGPVVCEDAAIAEDWLDRQRVAAMRHSA